MKEYWCLFKATLTSRSTQSEGVLVRFQDNTCVRADRVREYTRCYGCLDVLVYYAPACDFVCMTNIYCEINHVHGYISKRVFLKLLFFLLEDCYFWCNLLAAVVFLLIIRSV